MTLPDERYRAINKARDFLVSLLDHNATPRVPQKVREEAYNILKHYISSHELEIISKKSPKILRKSNA